jgi:ligand-binding sensor domain-containing protein
MGRVKRIFHVQGASVRTAIQTHAAVAVVIPDTLTQTIRAHAWGVSLLIAVLLVPMGLAATPASLPADFRHTTWTVRDGAQTDLNAMTQTSDGSLWLGGVNGLFRFDALHFEEVDLPQHPELRLADVYSLLATPDGGLWIGYDLRGAAFLKDGEVTVYSVSDGLPAGTVRSMGRQRDGTIWAATSDGLARFRHGRWEDMDKAWRHPDVIRSLFVDGDDTVWVTAASGVYSKRRGSDNFLKVLQQFHGAGVLAQSSTGAVWAYDEDSIRVVGHAAALPKGTRQPGTGIFFDTTGVMWLVADDSRGGGLLRIPSTALTEKPGAVIATDTFAPIDSVTLRSPNMELADDEGDIWIIGEGGLERVSTGNFLSLKRMSNYPVRGRHSVAAGDDGRLWIGNALRVTPTSPPGLVAYRDGQFEATAGIHDVSCIIQAEGAVWIGDRSALWKKKGDQLSRFDLPWHADFARFQSMAGDGKGGVWASVLYKGMYRFVDGIWTSYPRLLMPLVVATDWSGQLWLGYSDGRLAMFDGSSVTWFSTAQGLDIGAVTAIEARHGHVWAGGSSGMARLDGHRFITLDVESGLAPRKIRGIVERSNGDLWLLGAMGIERILADEVQKGLTDPAHALSARLFDTGDGLEGFSGIRPVPALVEGTDGMLWATTSADIYRIDPDHLTREAPTAAVGAA